VTKKVKKKATKKKKAKKKTTKKLVKKKVTKKKAVKKPLSTYEEMIKDPKRKKRFAREYKKLACHEMLLNMAEGDGAALRELAREVKLPAATVKKLKMREGPFLASDVFDVVKALGLSIEVVNK
jgi:aminopeptidase C